MKFNISILSLVSGFIAAAKGMAIQELFLRECGESTISHAEECINEYKGIFHYTFDSSSGCDIQYVCMVPCSDNDSIISTKTLNYNKNYFISEGKAYCKAISNLSVCQTDLKYFDSKSCILLTKSMDNMNSLPENYKELIKPVATAVKETEAKSDPIPPPPPPPTSAPAPPPPPAPIHKRANCGIEGAQCGGRLFMGSTCCGKGLKCKFRSTYYSVCVKE